MRGVPVSLILGIFVILASGAADAHWSGRGGYGHRQDSDGRCNRQEVEVRRHRQDFVGHCPRQEVDGHGGRQVPTGVSCRERFGWRLFCSANWREHATTCCSADTTIKALRAQIQKEQEKINELLATIKGYDEKIKQAAVDTKEAQLKTDAANAKSTDADKRLAAAQEALAAAGQMSATAAKAKQDADTAKATSDALIADNKKLNDELTQRQQAFVKQADGAKHREDEVIEQIKTRWDQVFVNLRGVDPCRLASVPANKAAWDNTAPKAETSVAAETESGKGGMDRTKTEPDAAGARSTGMSERSRASLE
jgi:hypothetical protein